MAVAAPDPDPSIEERPWRRAARWIAAAIPILYGFAKLTGAQFTILLSELDRPLGEVSGFWLTWYYFGYSAVYGNLLALVQIGGGLLLTFRKTALAGALLLFPIAANIVLVDVFYGVDLGGLAAALVLLTLLVWIIYPYRGRLLRAVALRPGDDRRRWLRWAGRGALVIGAFAFTCWAANFNNRAPTPIDGAWNATEPGAARSGIEEVFFEPDRAHMAVVKDTAGEYHRRHFEVGPGDTVRVWEAWLERERLILEGRYGAEASTVELWPPGDTGATIRLRRADEP